jgi:hypothetical protein
LKTDDYYFVEYPDIDDEPDVNLNEIDQIDEEFGERIKYLTVAPRPKSRPRSSRLRMKDVDSFNERAEFNDLPTTKSREMSGERKEEESEFDLDLDREEE